MNLTRTTLFCLLLATSAFAQRTRVVRDPSPATWLHQHAIATSDLTPLVSLIGDAQVVALGDATHGTHEFFTFKQHVVPLLAANGFRTLALEAPYAELAAIDEGGDIAAAVQSNDYFFWDCDEIIELLTWCRANGVAIAGVDCAHPYTAIDRLVGRLAERDPALAADVASKYELVLSFRSAPRMYESISPATRAMVRAGLDAVRPLLASRRDAFASDDAYELALHEARVIEQGEEAYATGLRNRDEAMAENVRWLAARRGRLILAGHNEHLGRTDYTLDRPAPTRSTGAYIAESLRYFAIGSVTDRGSFNAYLYTANTAMLREHAIPPAAPDDIATVLDDAAMPEYVIATRAAPMWLQVPHTIRIAGTNAVSAAHPAIAPVEALAEKFDALLYVETTSPSHLRHWPTLP